MKKRLLALILTLTLCLSLAACASGGSSAKTVPGELPDLMDKITADVPDLPKLGNIDLDAENFEFYAFIQPVEGATALASEAMVSSIAHSAVLLRLPEGTDAKTVAKSIEESANPRKWICVEAEKVTVSVNGDLVLLVMSTEAVADAMTKNFLAL